MEKTADSIRTFIGIPLPEDVVADIAASVAALRRDYFETAKWIAPSAMHITLKFLGDVPENQLPAITDAMHAAAVNIESYRLQPHGFGAFPNQRRPRILWVGTLSPPSSHHRMFNQLETQLHHLGFEPEKRPHSPHITVARIKSKKQIPWPPENFYVNLFDNYSDFCVNSIVLFKSTLSPQGAKYSRLHETPLTDNSVSGGTIDG